MRLFYPSVLKICIIVLLIASTNFYSKAQNEIFYGVSGMYNIPLKNIGIGVRAQIPVWDRVELVPQVKYVPSFNKIHELYGGANLHFLLIEGNEKINGRKPLYERTRPDIYLAAGVEYNRWIDYVETKKTNSGRNNILPEAGMGISYGNKTIRFFGEVKYNILWNESYLEAGLLVCPSRIFKQNKSNKCPRLY